mmetsp:Transcript_31083/g.66866  ORF Transcript_31083/g.66866 Transcript_31083/m.66866 type:complete len:90 (-) Transcript_31083:790-1059(-)
MAFFAGDGAGAAVDEAPKDPRRGVVAPGAVMNEELLLLFVLLLKLAEGSTVGWFVLGAGLPSQLWGLFGGVAGLRSSTAPRGVWGAGGI